MKKPEGKAADAVTSSSVTVRVFPDGRVATQTRFAVRRVDRRWRFAGTHWNPVSGEWDSFVHVTFLPRVRTKAWALRLCRGHFKPSWGWWAVAGDASQAMDYVRGVAKKAGVRVRFVPWKGAK